MKSHVPPKPAVKKAAAKTAAVAKKAVAKKTAAKKVAPRRMVAPSEPDTSTAGGATLAAYIGGLSTSEQAQFYAPQPEAAKGVYGADLKNPVPWVVPHGGKSKSVLREADDISQEALRMPKEKTAALVKQMQAVGMLDEGPVTRMDFEKAWDDLVGMAVRWHSANPKSRLTPEDMLDLYFGDGGEDPDGKGVFTGHGKAKGGKPPTAQKVVQKEMTVATNEEARGLLNNMLTRELGRRPTDREVDNFQAALNDAQRKNPFTTTTNMGGGGMGGGRGGAEEVEYDAKGKPIKTTSTTKTGGVDPQEFADQYFRRTYDSNGVDSEHGAYQAAALYMPALMQALKGTV